MELRHLRYFVVVAEELNFSRAANRLNMSQPPLSQQIHQLENELGVRLFDRTKRKVELTGSGRILLKSLYKILNDIENACTSAQKAQRGEIGNIMLGFTGTVAFDILPSLLRCYRTTFPLVDLGVFQLSTASQVHSLLNGEINIGIIFAPIENPEVNFEVIREEPLIIAMSENHPLASRLDPIEVQELSKELFIMIPRNEAQVYYDTMINTCHNSGFSPNITQEVHELYTSISLVAAGLGVALVPKSIQVLQVKGTVYRQLKNSVAILKTALAWRNDESSPLVHSFITLAKKNVNFYGVA